MVAIRPPLSVPFLPWNRNYSAWGAAVQRGDSRYPVALPYCIAETIKGYGFPGAGTNAAHGLPLGSNPRRDAEALRFFHKGAKALWQDEQQWRAAVAELKQPKTPVTPVAVTVNRHDPHWHKDNISPMAALDGYFVDLIEVNPQLRVRVGNPDELSSNRMNQTLDHPETPGD